jgi:hypothetical protein
VFVDVSVACGTALVPFVFSFADDAADRGFAAESVLSGDKSESISMASASPFVASSAKAWYFGREASVWVCAFGCGTEVFRPALGRFVASEARRGDVSFVVG